MTGTEPDHLPDGIEPREADDRDGILLAIGNGYLMNLVVFEDSTRLRVEPENDTGGRFTANISREWWTSNHKIRTLGNEIATDTGLSAEWIKRRLREVGEYFEAAEAALLTAEAVDILQRTEDVRAYQQPDELILTVWIDAPEESKVDGTRRLQFDASALNADSPSPLESAYLTQFLTTISIANRDWDYIRNEWLEQAELEQSETMSEEDIIADRIVEILQSRVAGQVYADKDPVPNNIWNSYYEPASASKYDENTVWVGSEALQQILEDETSKSPTGYLGTLSRTLQRDDVTLGDSAQRRFAGRKKTVYAFRADALNIAEETVRSFNEQTNIEESEDGSDSGVIKP